MYSVLYFSYIVNHALRPSINKLVFMERLLMFFKRYLTKLKLGETNN